MPTDELIGTDAAAYVHPDDVERAIASSIERMDAGRTPATRTQPIRMLSTSGRVVWVRFDSLPVEDDAQPYVIATMTDVTVEMEAELARERSENWSHVLLEHQNDIVTVVTFDGMVRYISPNCERLLGIPAEDLVGTSGAANIHPDDLEPLMVALGAQLAGDADARPFEYRQRCADGSWLWLEATGRALPAEFGADAIIVNARDVTERRRAQEAEREAERSFRNAFATSPLGIAFADLDGKLTWVNEALADTVGLPASQLLAMRFRDFSTEEELRYESGEAVRLLRGEIEWFQVEKRYDHPDGRTVWALLHVSLVRDSRGRPTQLLGQLQDISDRKQLELSLTHDALHDPLTGLLNRAGLRGRVDLAWEARCPDAPVAILFGDLDGFKGVNDTLGHDAGDEVLVHVAQRLHRAVRAGDVVARWGGDEFVILCPSVEDAADAVRIADRIRAAMESPFRISPGSATVGISIGVALDTGQPLPDLLVKDADAAALQAKVAGRNCVVVASA